MTQVALYLSSYSTQQDTYSRDWAFLGLVKCYAMAASHVYIGQLGASREMPLIVPTASRRTA